MTQKRTYSLVILFILHFVGIFLFVFTPEAAKLSYVTLTITGILLLLNEKKLKSVFLAMLITFVGGFVIEFIGTKTGLLFGEYAYGESLGFKLFNVPLVIGLNWLIVVRSSLAFTESLVKVNRIITAIFSGILCTFLDFLIEPVAIKYDFWHWSGNHIPIYNYLCWFAFSALFSFIFLLSKSRTNKLAVPIFIIWTVFFVILNLL